MTQKQFVAVVANMRAQSLYQQQMIGHLVGLVHGLKEILVEVAGRSGMDTHELSGKFASATRAMNNTLAEIPFPEWQIPSDDSPPDGTSSQPSPPDVS